MKLENKIAAICLGFIALSCKPVSLSTKTEQTEVKQTPLFSKGKKIESENFTGTAYLEMLVLSDSINQTSVGNVTFEPKARTKWHLHPAGQILLVTDGIGYYQEKGQSKKILKKGDVIKCPSNIEHWHGASNDSHFVQVAITSNEKGSVVWLEPVTEDEYNQ